MSVIQFLRFYFGEFDIGSTNNPITDIFFFFNTCQLYVVLIYTVRRNSVLVTHGSLRVSKEGAQNLSKVVTVVLFVFHMQHQSLFDLSLLVDGMKQIFTAVSMACLRITVAPVLVQVLALRQIFLQMKKIIIFSSPWILQTVR